jgi:hypothetical protein
MSNEGVKRTSVPAKTSVHDKPNNEVEMGQTKADAEGNATVDQSDKICPVVTVTEAATESSPCRPQEVMKINDKSFIVTERNREELKALSSIADRESGHAQWLKQLVTVGLGVLCLV